MSLELNKQVPVLCWKCRISKGLQIVMNGIVLKAVHHIDHANELIEQLEMGRIGKQNIYELIEATVPEPDSAPQQP